MFFLLRLLPVLLIVSSFSCIQVEARTPQKIIGPHYISLAFHSKEEFRKIIETGIILDERKADDRVWAWATDEDLEYLENQNFRYMLDTEPGIPKGAEKGYLTYDDLTAKLKKIVASNPGIMAIESLGKTVKNREIWAVKVSDNVKIDEAEPEIKYVSTMHGDEVVGQELLVRLLEHIAKNVASDARLQHIINNTEMWLIPNMNPDGTSLRRRANANSVDLNRDFPDPSSNEPNTPTGRARETQNMLAFTDKHNFILSLNFHGGATVVNYLWDSWAALAPDNNFVVDLAKEYAKENPPMYRSHQFSNGITNGYQWYSINGGMQDWNYFYYGCMDFTIELDDVKWPDYSRIDALWSDNLESFLIFAERAKAGAHGIVVDNITGQPIKASYRITGIDKTMFTALPHGDFHRMLLSGRHEATFSAEGYLPAKVLLEAGENSVERPVMIKLQKISV